MSVLIPIITFYDHDFAVVSSQCYLVLTFRALVRRWAFSDMLAGLGSTCNY